LPCACFRSGINAKRTHAPKWTPPNTHSALAPKWTVPLLSPLPQHSQLRCFRDFAMRPPSLRARRFLVAVPLLPSFFPSGSWASGCGGAGVLVWRPRSARHQVKRHSAQSCGADPLRSSTSIFIRQHSHAHCLHSLPHSVCRHNEPSHHARLLALALFLPALHRTAMHQSSRHHTGTASIPAPLVACAASLGAPVPVFLASGGWCFWGGVLVFWPPFLPRAIRLISSARVAARLP